MRILVLGFLLVSSLAIGSVSHAARAGDYWPWGKEVEFPWKGIQGVWMTYDRPVSPTYFVFKVLTQNQEQILKVEQYDNATCKLMGQGLGYEKGRVVKARFTGIKGDFDLKIHVFRESDVLKLGGNFQARQSSKLVTVMATNPVNNPSHQETLQIYKVDSNLGLNCR